MLIRRLLAYRLFLVFVGAVAAGVLYHLWTRETALHVPWIPDSDARLFAQRPLRSPDPATAIGAYKLPLRTKGRDVVDQRGHRFKLAGVNWYGGSDELFVVGGLDVRHRDDIAATILRLGFNTVRLPYADELVVTNPRIPLELVAANPDLADLPALDVFAAVVEALTGAGVAVIINNHITTATWCCGADPCDSGWANDGLPESLWHCRLRQTEDQWIEHWETVMARFTNDSLVIGADLRNEVRGLWGTMPWPRWAKAAERCANRLLAMHPDWLMIVGGTESNNDLRGVADRPIRLNIDDRVVYAAHVYSWSGWGSLGGRYAQRSYKSFAAAMHEHWAYLLDRQQAPVWVNEFGSPHEPGVGDAHYWNNLMRFLRSVDADFAYWALNPRKAAGNATETYSLLQDDWKTPVLDYRMRDMTELMALPQEL